MSSVREKIDDHLRKTNAYQEVKALLAEHAKATSLAGGMSERAALERLLSRTLPVTATAPPLAAPTAVAAGPSITALQSAASAVGSHKRDSLQLRVALRGGRAFAGGMLETGSGGVRWALRAHLLFNEQRATSPAVELRVNDPNPAVEGMFAFELCASGLPARRDELLAMKEPLRICLTKEVMVDGASPTAHCPLPMAPEGRGAGDFAGGVSASDFALTGLTRVLLGTAAVDWRQALVKRGETFAVEVQPAGDDLEGSTGILVVGLDLLPPASWASGGNGKAGGSVAAIPFNVDVAELLAQISAEDPEAAAALASEAAQAGIDEQLRAGEAAREFFVHARAVRYTCRLCRLCRRRRPRRRRQQQQQQLVASPKCFFFMLVFTFTSSHTSAICALCLPCIDAYTCTSYYFLRHLILPRTTKLEKKSKNDV